jgi:hypothetical protein
MTRLGSWQVPARALVTGRRSTRPGLRNLCLQARPPPTIS